jgi:hypothetical protein
MLYSEIIAVCSQIHTKYTNALCGQNAEFFNFKLAGTCSNHWALMGWMLDICCRVFEKLIVIQRVSTCCPLYWALILSDSCRLLLTTAVSPCVGYRSWCSDWATGWTTWGWIPGKRKRPLLQNVQTCLLPTQSPIQWVSGAFFRG